MSDDDHDGPIEDDPERRRLFERAVPEVIRRLLERAVESGVERLTEAPENIRDLISEMKLPKEAAQILYDQVDDTKKGMYRVVAKEIRDVLEHINFADEIANVLTKLQFEINTTIRFVPNTQADEEAAEAGDTESTEGEAGEAQKKKRPSLIPRPEVVSKVVMKARDALKKPRE